MPKDKKSLRQMMTEEFKGYGWLDSSYRSKNKDTSEKEYVKFLDSLDDEDFLSKYKQITKNIDSLD